MLLMPLIAAALENGLNRLLYRDRAMTSARSRLKGKVLRVELAELDTPVILVFSELQLDVLTAWDGAADCHIRTHLSALPALSKRQQLAQMIRQGELEVDGDLQVVQQFVALLDMAQCDPADVLAPYTGDILAEGLTRSLHGRLQGIQRRWRDGQSRLSQTITDEWRLAPQALELAWFNEEVDGLARDGQALANRLQQLEANR